MKLLFVLLVSLSSLFINFEKVMACPCTPEVLPVGYCACGFETAYANNGCVRANICDGIIIDGLCSVTPNAFISYCDIGYPEITENPPPPQAEDGNQCSGSIVKIENQSLQENIPLNGSDFDLVYSSERVFGRKDNLRFSQVIPPPSDMTVTEIFIERYVNSILMQTNPYTITGVINYNYEWNGLNNSNQEIIDGVDHEIQVKYEFNNTSPPVIINKKNPPIGFYNVKLLGLGGFSISNLHFYNLKTRKLHLGTGNDLSIEPIKVNKTVDVIQKLLPDTTIFTNYLVVSKAGDEAYIFDTMGYHIETRSTRTSKVLSKFNYNANNQLTSIQDSFLNSIQINRPNLTTVMITTPSGKATTLTLNINGFATQVSTPNLENYVMTYSASGLMQTFQTPKGLISTFIYDTNGRLVEDSNNQGHLVGLNVVNWQPNQRLIQAISAQGRITQFFSQIQTTGDSSSSITKPSGAITSVNDNPSSTSNTYENGFSITTSRILDPRFDSQAYTDISTDLYTHQINHAITQNDTFTYSNTDLLKLNGHTKTETYDAKTWTTTYDPVTQTYTEASPLNRQIKTKLNNFDQVVEERFATYAPFVYVYDTLGRLDTITQSARIWDYTYNSEFEVLSLKNPLNQITSYLYDNNGKVSQITYPNLDVVQLEYDQIGNIKRLKANPKPWHEMVYNLFGDIIEYISPNIGSIYNKTSYFYNNDKQLTKIIRDDLFEDNFNYNATTGLLESIVSPEGNYTYTTNLTTGQLSEINSTPNLNTKIEYVYLSDVLDTQFIKEGVNHSSYKYTYSKMLPSSVTLRHQDLDSNVSHIANIIYNNDRLMTNIGDLTLTRTAATGFVASAALVGGMNETNTYDPTYGEISQYLVRYNTTNRFREVYTRDLLSRITRNAVTINSSPVVNYDYVYDLRGRLIEAKTNNVIQRKYTYDTNSNRTQVRNATNVILATGSYNDQDRLTNYQVKNTSGVNINNFNYDYYDTGRRFTKVDTVNNTKELYYWDAKGALFGVLRRNNTTNAIIKQISYKNDGLGRRILRLDSQVPQVRYIYDEKSRLVGEVSPNGDILTHYIYADKSHTPSYMRRGTLNFKFVTDALGSIRYVYNGSTGALVQAITYDEFGNILTDSNPGFQSLGFAGGLYDRDTKLTRFGARDYDAQTGRWISKDPIRFEGGDTNLYGYVLQDPVNFIDPEGLMSYAEENGLPAGGSGGIPIPGGGAGIGIGIGSGMGAPMVLPDTGEGASCNDEPKGGHTKNKRKSTQDKHDRANERRRRDQGGEKKDPRMPYKRK